MKDVNRLFRWRFTAHQLQRCFAADPGIATVGKAAFHLTTWCNGKVFISYIACDPRTALDRQVAHLDRSVNQPG